MADFESFSGPTDGSEAMDPAAFERFKERMAAAAAQIKAAQAGEQKQKKKEDELAKILLKFIQSGDKRDILLLISRLLEQNIPAAFIVSILLISNPAIQHELGVKLLPSTVPENGKPQTLPDRYLPDQTIPLRIKLAIDAWVQEMVKYAAERPHRLLETAVDESGVIKLPLLQLSVLCLQEFLNTHQIQPNYDSLKQFMQLMLEGILKNIREDLKKQKQLKK